MTHSEAKALSREATESAALRERVTSLDAQNAAWTALRDMAGPGFRVRLTVDCDGYSLAWESFEDGHSLFDGGWSPPRWAVLGEAADCATLQEAVNGARTAQYEAKPDPAARAHRTEGGA